MARVTGRVPAFGSGGAENPFGGFFVLFDPAAYVVPALVRAAGRIAVGIGVAPLRLRVEDCDSVRDSADPGLDAGRVLATEAARVGG